MLKAKVLIDGDEQTVKLPKEYRLSDDEVFVNRLGDLVVLIPKDNQWTGLINSLDMFTDDFMIDGRKPLFE